MQRFPMVYGKKLYIACCSVAWTNFFFSGKSPVINIDGVDVQVFSSFHQDSFLLINKRFAGSISGNLKAFCKRVF